ncbi:uncharacterized protein LOC133493804 isoform X3 [Syngnathoides biaculeatus]|uniref:uncharacterized protein LOC133493804 isoform X3 n=1 Tax=Syngnathoides biaculeatus TaxID=300417 RepID=UPI002ADD3E0C|nr:uncharacterized protein LOC133493804 isoform X3 [Syngnathoides biaculeatus]
MPSCCVAGFCSNTREDGFSLHKFPKDPIYREKWTAQVQRTRALWVPHERSVLCSAHFEESCFDSRPALKASLGFEVRYPRVLLDTAVPTIFPRPEHGQSAYCKKEPPPRKRSGSRAIEKREKLRVLAEALGSDYVPAAGSEAEASFPDQDHGKGGDHVKMCAKTSGEYREKVCGPKKEAVPQRQLLEAVFNLQPRIVLCRADVSEYLHPGRQQSVSSHIKEEEEGEEVQHTKEEEEEVLHRKEEEQEGSIQVPATGVHLKSEDVQSEERRVAQPPESALLAECGKTHEEFFSRSQCYPVAIFRTTWNSSSDGDHCVGSQTDDDDELSEGDMTCHAANKCWKCSRCRKTFPSMKNFKQHVKIHTEQCSDVRDRMATRLQPFFHQGCPPPGIAAQGCAPAAFPPQGGLHLASAGPPKDARIQGRPPPFPRPCSFTKTGRRLFESVWAQRGDPARSGHANGATLERPAGSQQLLLQLGYHHFPTLRALPVKPNIIFFFYIEHNRSTRRCGCQPALLLPPGPDLFSRAGPDLMPEGAPAA